MCGRFSITGDLDFYAEYFGVDNVVTESLGKSWNVAPTDPVYVVGEKDGERQLGTMNWGLVPHWAANTKTIHINARAETVDTNAAFRDSLVSGSSPAACTSTTSGTSRPIACFRISLVQRALGLSRG